jgi:hypothetical protein
LPRITVYVPDDLKAQMDKAGGDINWSALMQRAVENVLSPGAVRCKRRKICLADKAARKIRQRLTDVTTDIDKVMSRLMSALQAEREHSTRHDDNTQTI